MKVSVQVEALQSCEGGEDGPMEKEEEEEATPPPGGHSTAGDDAPSATDNLSRTLQQLPWGLDCTQLVVRGVGAVAAAAPPLCYNGAATVW